MSIQIQLFSIKVSGFKVFNTIRKAFVKLHTIIYLIKTLNVKRSKKEIESRIFPLVLV